MRIPKWKPLLWLGCSLLVLSCGTVDSRDETSEPTGMTGMLVVTDPQDCAIPEGCGPKCKLYDESFSTFMPLLGPIADSLSGLVITVHGSQVPLPPEEQHQIDYTGPTTAIWCDSLEVRSGLRYYEFLPRAVELYSQQRFGCVLPWNKTFGWALSARAPRLSARLTDFTSISVPRPFIQVSFDGNSGAVVGTTDNLGGRNPCSP